jgi:hypothetical protein
MVDYGEMSFEAVSLWFGAGAETRCNAKCADMVILLRVSLKKSGK